jgi:ParB family chromosome partitioning protein
MKFEEVSLSRLKPSPFNPRETFNEAEDEKLRASIKSNGIIQNLLVRPVGKHLEIVCGHRRFNQASILAKSNGGLSKNKVPVVIRDLTDDQAFEIMTIENLQRENLTNFDQAKGFKSFIDRNKNGKEAIEKLANNLGISPGFIRARVAVMELPKIALDNWKSGKLSFAHLEQFIRVKDPETLIKQTIENGISASRLKSNIDWRAPELSKAKFNIKTAGCPSCHHNTSTQKKLFDIDDDKTKCLNSPCYIDNTRKWYVKNWKKGKTNGYRFYHEIDNYESIWSSEIDAECKKCDNLVSIVDLTGHNNQELACINSACYRKKRKAAKAPAAAKVKGAPRVQWHGDYFREKFYTERIPQIIEKNLKPDDEVALRLSVFSIVLTHGFLHGWFAEKFNIKQEYGLKGSQIFEPLKKLKVKDLKLVLKEATAMIITNKDFYSENRQIVAEHLAIDLKKEWVPDEEYFSKKLKSEILDMGHKFKIFSQKPVKTYLSQKLGKLPNQIETLKKSELVDLFLKSGANLSGVVPEEIWKIS